MSWFPSRVGKKSKSRVLIKAPLASIRKLKSVFPSLTTKTCSLYVRRRKPRVRLVAQMDGGGHERGMRSGTLNVPGIVGLGEACRLGRLEMEKDAKHATELRERLEKSITDRLDHVHFNGSREHHLEGCLNLYFPYVEANTNSKSPPMPCACHRGRR